MKDEIKEILSLLKSSSWCNEANQIEDYITNLQESEAYYYGQYKDYKSRNEKALEYIENEMPCLWEVDNAWEDINGNYQHNYKEYDTQILLNKLKGSDKE